MRKTIKKLVGLGVVVGVFVVASGAGWMLFDDGTSRAAPATVKARIGDVEKTVLASGALEARSVVGVGAQVSGRIETIGVDLGDTVKKGQLVVTIDSQNQQYALKTAEAALANVEAQRQEQSVAVDQARLAVERSEKLSGKNLVSTLDLETARADLESAKAKIAGIDAQIQQAELAVDTARVNLERTQITAPAAGTVVAVLVSEGQTVNASQTAPTLIKIADLDRMQIKAQISEADVTRIKAGQEAYFSILGEPDKPIDAKLLSIEPAPSDIETADTGLTADDQAVYYNGIFVVDNPDHRLRIAMTAQVTIIVADARDVLTVPSGAIVKDRDDNPYVLVYDRGTEKTRRRAVEVGLDNDIVAEITDGLEKGDRVVAANAEVRSRQNSDTRRMMRRMGRHGFGA